MNLKGHTVELHKTPQETFVFLSDCRNFKEVLPKETVKFEATENSFLFALSGMPDISLELKEKEEFDKITYSSNKGSIDFDLIANISESENGSQITFEFEGKLNPMLKMMVQKPLQNLLNTMSENIEE